ncbi:MAG: gamma-glutamylcyclotransferase [Alphaproteobacteria bacterium]|nr:gamma-glutamylcyclotransferase [Alphaproteobacteria bacterium]
MRFFFYGTLLDRDVMALVIGRRLPPGAFLPAILPAHSRRRVKGASYPIAVRDRRDAIHGKVVGGLSRRDVERLSAYEGAGYRIASLKVREKGMLSKVAVFAPLEERFQPTSGAWSLTLWQRRDKRTFVGRLRRAFSGRPGCSTR